MEGGEEGEGAEAKEDETSTSPCHFSPDVGKVNEELCVVANAAPHAHNEFTPSQGRTVDEALAGRRALAGGRGTMSL